MSPAKYSVGAASRFRPTLGPAKGSVGADPGVRRTVGPALYLANLPFANFGNPLPELSPSESDPRPQGRDQPPNGETTLRGRSMPLGPWLIHASRVAVIAAALAATSASAQFKSLEVAAVLAPAPVKVEAGKTVDVPLSIRIRNGYHINSDTPADSYLIPTRLMWDAPGFKTASVKYPEAETVKYDFSDKPLSVYSGTIQITSTLTAPAKIPAGLTELTGKFRYQACNEKACLPPRTADFKVPFAAR